MKISEKCRFGRKKKKNISLYRLSDSMPLLKGDMNYVTCSSFLCVITSPFVLAPFLRRTLLTTSLFAGSPHNHPPFHFPSKAPIHVSSAIVLAQTESLSHPRQEALQASSQGGS